VKKLIILALLIVIAASGAFALERTVGFGAMYNQQFAGGTGWESNTISLGVFGFFGLSQYFEANVGFMQDVSRVWRDRDSGDTRHLNPMLNRFLIGLYFKYPFPISDTMVIFPTIGADFQYTIEATAQYIWPRAGLGLDYFLNERMFIRGHFIYGMAFAVIGNPNNLDYFHGFQVKAGLGWMF
jgi:hypothetical protein